MKAKAANDYEIWVLLHQTCHALSKVRENELRPYGITMMQAGILFIIKTIEDPVIPAEIARWIFLERNTVSGILNRMEEQGLINQVKDLGKKNLIRVTLTEKGEEAYQRSSELRAIHETISSLSEEQRESLRTCLTVWRDKALEELRPAPKLPFP